MCVTWGSITPATVTLVTCLFLLPACGVAVQCPLDLPSCGECIQAHPECAWCSQQGISGSRCGQEAELLSRGCLPENLHHPSTSFIVTRDLPLDPQAPTVRPQGAMLRLHKGEEIQMKVEVSMGWNDPAVTFSIASPRWVKVIPGSYCLDFSMSSQPGSCGRADNGKLPLVAYDFTVQLKECPPKNSTGPYRILIRPVGHDDLLTIDLEPLCRCDCEEAGSLAEKGAGECGERGKEQCGVCQCQEGYYGHQCLCEESRRSQYPPDSNCLKPGNTLKDGYCSGRGDCACGVCHCHTKSAYSLLKYTGTHCECDDESCPVSETNGLMCGGPKRGVCRCGQCQCLQGFAGRSCQDILLPDIRCVNADGLVCKGRGECVDNTCTCQAPFFGPMCETCEGEDCDCLMARDCVLCQVFQSGVYTAPQCARRCYDTITLPVLERSTLPGFKVCKVRDPVDGCDVTFSYAPSGSRSTQIYNVLLMKDC